MKRAKITSKGQITVPHEILRALGARAGDHLLFVEEGAEVCVRLERIESPFEKFRGIGTPGISGGKRGIARWVRGLRGR